MANPNCPECGPQGGHGHLTLLFGRVTCNTCHPPADECVNILHQLQKDVDSLEVPDAGELRAPVPWSPQHAADAVRRIQAPKPSPSETTFGETHFASTPSSLHNPWYTPAEIAEAQHKNLSIGYAPGAGRRSGKTATAADALTRRGRWYHLLYQTEIADAKGLGSIGAELDVPRSVVLTTEGYRDELRSVLRGLIHEAKISSFGDLGFGGDAIARIDESAAEEHAADESDAEERHDLRRRYYTKQVNQAARTCYLEHVEACANNRYIPGAVADAVGAVLAGFGDVDVTAQPNDAGGVDVDAYATIYGRRMRFQTQVCA